MFSVLVPPGEKLTKKALEKKVSSDVSTFMKRKGWRRLRQQSGMVTRLVAGRPEPGQMFSIGEKGMCDLLFIYYFDGRKGACVVVWVETKRARGGTLSEDQIQWQAEERGRGALIVNVKDVHEFAQWYSDNLAWIHELKGQAELFG